MSAITNNREKIAKKNKLVNKTPPLKGKTRLLTEEELIDRKASYFIAAYYLVEAVNLTIKMIFPISGHLWSLMSNGFMAVLAFLLIRSISPVLDRTHRSFLMVEISFIILFLVSLLQGNAERSLLLATAFRTLFVSVPIAFYVLSIKNKQIFYDTLLKISYVLIVILSLVFLMRWGVGSYYTMSVSYALLLPALFQLNEFLKKRRFINFVFSLIAVIGIVLFGARGPVLCILTFFVLKYLLSDKSLASKIATAFLACLVLALVLVFWDSLANALILFLENRGIYSRTLVSLARGSILQGSGRDRLFAHYLGLVEMKPFLGWGLMGGWIAEGSGPHNMLIELLLAFGVIGGALLCMVAVGFVARVFFIKNRTLQNLAAIYCAYNIVMFFVSGGVLRKVDWFIFAALCFSIDKVGSAGAEKSKNTDFVGKDLGMAKRLPGGFQSGS